MLLWQSRRFSFFLRSIALLTCFFFTSQSVGWAEIAQTLRHPSETTHSPDSSNIIDPSSIRIPTQFGQIKSVHHGRKNALVVHIQDAHINEDAQRNIGNIIKVLGDKYGLKTAHLESASGELTPKIFSSFPQKKALRTLSDYYLSQGRMSGSEYLAINDFSELKLHGVENMDLYEKNRQAYVESLKFRQKNEDILLGLRKILHHMMRFIFSENLQKLTREKIQFEESQEDLIRYVNFLVSFAEKQGISLEPFSGIQALAKLARVESEIQLKDSEKLLDLVTTDLKKRMPEGRLSVLLAKSIAYKTEKLPKKAFYEYLTQEILNLQKQSRIPTSMEKKYAKVLKYLEVVTLYESIDIHIFDEMESLENAIRHKLFRNEDEQQLHHLLQVQRTLEKMFRFQLTKSDVEFFLSHEKDFGTKTFVSYLVPLMKKHHFELDLPKNLNELDRDLPKVQKFYEYALQRDPVLIQNTIRNFAASNEKVTAVVTGGFHTPGIEQELRKEGYSYLVVTPAIHKKIDAKKEETLYEEALREDPTALEKSLLEMQYGPQKSRGLSDPHFQLGARLLLDRTANSGAAGRVGRSSTLALLGTKRSETRAALPLLAFANTLMALSLLMGSSEGDLRRATSNHSDFWNGALEEFAGAKTHQVGQDTYLIPNADGNDRVTVYGLVGEGTSKSEVRAIAGLRSTAAHHMIPLGDGLNFVQIPTLVSSLNLTSTEIEPAGPKSEVRRASPKTSSVTRSGRTPRRSTATTATPAVDPDAQNILAYQPKAPRFQFANASLGTWLFRAILFSVIVAPVVGIISSAIGMTGIITIFGLTFWAPPVVAVVLTFGSFILKALTEGRAELKRDAASISIDPKATANLSLFDLVRQIQGTSLKSAPAATLQTLGQPSMIRGLFGTRLNGFVYSKKPATLSSNPSVAEMVHFLASRTGLPVETILLMAEKAGLGLTETHSVQWKQILRGFSHRQFEAYKHLQHQKAPKFSDLTTGLKTGNIFQALHFVLFKLPHLVIHFFYQWWFNSVGYFWVNQHKDYLGQAGSLQALSEIMLSVQKSDEKPVLAHWQTGNRVQQWFHQAIIKTAGFQKTSSTIIRVVKNQLYGQGPIAEAVRFLDVNVWQVSILPFIQFLKTRWMFALYGAIATGLVPFFAFGEGNLLGGFGTELVSATHSWAVLGPFLKAVVHAFSYGSLVYFMILAFIKTLPRFASALAKAHIDRQILAKLGKNSPLASALIDFEDKLHQQQLSQLTSTMSKLKFFSVPRKSVLDHSVVTKFLASIENAPNRAQLIAELAKIYPLVRHQNQEGREVFAATFAGHYLKATGKTWSSPVSAANDYRLNVFQWAWAYTRGFTESALPLHRHRFAGLSYAMAMFIGGMILVGGEIAALAGEPHHADQPTDGHAPDLADFMPQGTGQLITFVEQDAINWGHTLQTHIEKVTGVSLSHEVFETTAATLKLLGSENEAVTLAELGLGPQEVPYVRGLKTKINGISDEANRTKLLNLLMNTLSQENFQGGLDEQLRKRGELYRNVEQAVAFLGKTSEAQAPATSPAPRTPVSPEVERQALELYGETSKLLPDAIKAGNEAQSETIYYHGLWKVHQLLTQYKNATVSQNFDLKPIEALHTALTNRYPGLENRMPNPTEFLRFAALSSEDMTKERKQHYDAAEQELLSIKDAGDDVTFAEVEEGMKKAMESIVEFNKRTRFLLSNDEIAVSDAGKKLVEEAQTLQARGMEAAKRMRIIGLNEKIDDLVEKVHDLPYDEGNLQFTELKNGFEQLHGPAATAAHAGLKSISEALEVVRKDDEKAAAESTQLEAQLKIDVAKVEADLEKALKPAENNLKSEQVRTMLTEAEKVLEGIPATLETLSKNADWNTKNRAAWDARMAAVESKYEVAKEELPKLEAAEKTKRDADIAAENARRTAEAAKAAAPTPPPVAEEATITLTQTQENQFASAKVLLGGATFDTDAADAASKLNRARNFLEQLKKDVPGFKTPADVEAMIGRAEAKIRELEQAAVRKEEAAAPATPVAEPELNLSQKIELQRIREILGPAILTSDVELARKNLEAAQKAIQDFSTAYSQVKIPDDIKNLQSSVEKRISDLDADAASARQAASVKEESIQNAKKLYQNAMKSQNPGFVKDWLKQADEAYKLIGENAELAALKQQADAYLASRENAWKGELEARQTALEIADRTQNIRTLLNQIVANQNIDEARSQLSKANAEFEAIRQLQSDFQLAEADQKLNQDAEAAIRLLEQMTVPEPRPAPEQLATTPRTESGTDKDTTVPAPAVPAPTTDTDRDASQIDLRARANARLDARVAEWKKGIETHETNLRTQLQEVIKTQNAEAAKLKLKNANDELEALKELSPGYQLSANDQKLIQEAEAWILLLEPTATESSLSSEAQENLNAAITLLGIIPSDTQLVDASTKLDQAKAIVAQIQIENPNFKLPEDTQKLIADAEAKVRQLQQSVTPAPSPTPAAAVSDTGRDETEPKTADSVGQKADKKSPNVSSEQKITDSKLLFEAVFANKNPSVVKSALRTAEFAYSQANRATELKSLSAEASQYLKVVERIATIRESSRLSTNERNLKRVEALRNDAESSSDRIRSASQAAYIEAVKIVEAQRANRDATKQKSSTEPASTPTSAPDSKRQEKAVSRSDEPMPVVPGRVSSLISQPVDPATLTAPVLKEAEAPSALSDEENMIRRFVNESPETYGQNQAVQSWLQDYVSSQLYLRLAHDFRFEGKTEDDPATVELIKNPHQSGLLDRVVQKWLETLNEQYKTGVTSSLAQHLGAWDVAIKWLETQPNSSLILRERINLHFREIMDWMNKTPEERSQDVLKREFKTIQTASQYHPDEKYKSRPQDDGLTLDDIIQLNLAMDYENIPELKTSYAEAQKKFIEETGLSVDAFKRAKLDLIF